MLVPEYLTKRFKILLTKFCNRIASRLEFLNLSLHIPAPSEMRDKEHGEEGDRFERWEAESSERKRLRKWEWWFKFRVRKYVIYTSFFSRASLVEPGRFGSVQSVSDFENQNRTKPEIFCDFLIGFFSRFGFFGYFFSSFLSFLVFLLTPNQCLVVALISFLSFR